MSARDSMAWESGDAPVYTRKQTRVDDDKRRRAVHNLRAVAGRNRATNAETYQVLDMLGLVEDAREIAGEAS